MTQLMVTLDMIEPGGAKAESWMGFTPDHDIDKARARFIKKYGVEPERVEQIAGLLLVGPIPEGKRGR